MLLTDSIHNVPSGETQPKAVSKALGQLNSPDSIITIAEWLYFCQSFPVILEPLVKARNILRRKIVFPRVWRECYRRRLKFFTRTDVFELLDMSRQSIEILQLSISRLLVRLGKSAEDIQEWQTEQDFKSQYQFLPSLPFELAPSYEPPVLPVAQPRRLRQTRPHTSMYLERQRQLEAEMEAEEQESGQSQDQDQGDGSSLTRSRAGEDRETEGEWDIKRLLHKMKQDGRIRRTLVMQNDRRKMPEGVQKLQIVNEIDDDLFSASIVSLHGL